MSPAEGHVDVLIIGAGPAGLMCANGLAMAGIAVKIIDKRPSELTANQADGITPRTIEVLQSYGLAERLIREGNQIHMATFYGPALNGGIECTERKAIVTDPTARYPFLIGLRQPAIESVFIDNLRNYGIEIERSKQPLALEISEDVDELTSLLSHPVKVIVERLNAGDGENKTEIVHAKFVLGADGAHSWVRKTLGIDMEGEQTDYTWGVIDMSLETNFPDIRQVAGIQSVAGSCLLIPRENDRIRMYIQLSDVDVIDPLTKRVDKDMMSPEKLLSVARKILQPYKLSDPTCIEWWTVYIIGQRVACSYSAKDRVFIAGDACHTHSPKGGQGMNASMNDAHNLAWKIVQVLRGWSSPSLLKTYEYERRKFAQDLIDFDKKLAALFSAKLRTAENVDGIRPGELAHALNLHARFMTGTAIQYSASAVVVPKHQECATNLLIGQRMLPQIFVRAADIHPIDIQDMLPADIRFKALFFVGTLTSGRIVELDLLAEELDKPSSFFHRFSPGADGISTVFEIITIVASKKHEVNHLLVPPFLRPHWTKVLLDDTDSMERQGGHAYENFGIDPERITIVVVRPDGYIGAIAPSTAIADLENYFGSFMIPHRLDF